MNFKLPISFVVAIACIPCSADGAEKTLFQFDSPDATKQWGTVNDGVMGGRSDGRFKITPDGSMLFFGTLSLENNGGFASVRSRNKSLGLQAGESIVLRVRGDGREYNLNAYTPSRRIAFSHRATFRTKKDEWMEIEIPMDRFQATWFGRRVNAPLDPKSVNRLGILLGDKKPGQFKLEVKWVKLKSAT